MDFSPNGRWILTAGEDRHTYLWDAAGKLVRDLTFAEGVRDDLADVQFSADSTRFLICSGGSRITIGVPGSDANKDVFLDGRAGAPVRVAATGARFSPDGNLLAMGCGDGTVKLWDLRQPGLNNSSPPSENQLVHTDVVQSVRFAPVEIGGEPPEDLVLTASDDDWVQLWRRQAGSPWTERWRPQQRGTNVRGTGYSLHNPVRSVRFSPDGKWIAVAGGKQIVALLPSIAPASGMVARWQQKPPWDGVGVIRALPVERAEFNSDGKLLAVQGRSSTIDIRRTEDGALVCPLEHAAPIVVMAWDPQDALRLLTGSMDGTTSLWHIDPATGSGKLIHAFTKDHAGSVTAIAWSKGGSGFVTGGADSIANLYLSAQLP